MLKKLSTQRRKDAERNKNKKSWRFDVPAFQFFAIVFVALFCVLAAPVSSQTVAPESQTEINRDYELNITQDRITETDFERSTAAELSGETLSVKVGAGVRAERIDVILRGITGRVRFRASLEQLKGRFDRLQNLLQTTGAPR